MLKTVTKISQRRGTKSVKILFRIDVHKATLPAGSSAHCDWDISVCFERGGKVAASQDSHFDMLRDGTYEGDFDGASLSLVVTMFQDSKGKFLQKNGSLILRRRDPSSSLYVGLGCVILPLHYYANRYQAVDEYLPLEKCEYSGAGLAVTVTPKFTAQDDDNVSEAPSEVTEITSMAADFSVTASSQLHKEVGGIIVYFDEDADNEVPESVTKVRSQSASSVASGGSSGSKNKTYQVLANAVSGKSARNGERAPATVSEDEKIVPAADTMAPKEMSDDPKDSLRDELDDVTLQLVNARITIANLHMDLDEERKKYAHLHTQMREYYSRLAALEMYEAERANQKSSCSSIFSCLRPRPDPRRKFGRVLSTDPVLLEDVDEEVYTKRNAGGKKKGLSTSPSAPGTVSSCSSRHTSMEVGASVDYSSGDNSSHSFRSIPHTVSGGCKLSRKRSPLQRLPGKKKGVDTTGVPKPSWLN